MDDASKERLVRDGFVVLKNVVHPERVVAARWAVNSVRIMFCAPLPALRVPPVRSQRAGVRSRVNSDLVPWLLHVP